MQSLMKGFGAAAAFALLAMVPHQSASALPAVGKIEAPKTSDVTSVHYYRHYGHRYYRPYYYDGYRPYDGYRSYPYYGGGPLLSFGFGLGGGGYGYGHRHGHRW